VVSFVASMISRSEGVPLFGVPLQRSWKEPGTPLFDPPVRVKSNRFSASSGVQSFTIVSEAFLVLVMVQVVILPASTVIPVTELTGVPEPVPVLAPAPSFSLQSRPVVISQLVGTGLSAS